MLMRTDPFRELDRLAQQVWGTPARPASMPMDAWREGDKFVVEFDLPGVNADSLNLDVEHNTLTVHAERPARDPNQEMVAAERPRGVFSRQLFLADSLDADAIEKPEQLRDFVDEIGNPWFGVWLDIGNVRKLGPSEDWVRVLGTRIVKLDVKGDYAVRYRKEYLTPAATP